MHNNPSTDLFTSFLLWLSLSSVFKNDTDARHRPNENKVSDGGRHRASLGVKRWKSSQKWSVQRSVVRSIAWLGLWRGQWKWTDFHRLDQAARKGEPMAYVLIGKNCSSQVAHDLMHFDDDFPLESFGELERLDVRIDHRPLACPVAAHSLATVDVAAVHSIGPDDVLVHRGEERLRVASVEPVVETFEKFDFIRHSKPTCKYDTRP